MPIPKFEEDLNIIQGLHDEPGVQDGLSSAELKAKFDEAANLIKNYINEVVWPYLGMTTDVSGAIAASLDPTLSSAEKPAQAKAVGDAIADHRAFFANAVHGGDYVIKSGNCFSYTKTGTATYHINSGKAVLLGNMASMTGADVTLDTGTIGMKRNDLIVLRGTRNGAQIAFSIAVKKGVEASGTAYDPAVSSEDINGTGTTRELALYRVTFDGLSISGISAMFYAEEVTSEVVFRDISVPKANFTRYTSYDSVDINYRAAVPLLGVTQNMEPEVIFGVVDALEGNLSSVAETYNGGVYLYSGSVPASNITVPLIRIRKQVVT